MMMHHNIVHVVLYKKSSSSTVLSLLKYIVWSLILNTLDTNLNGFRCPFNALLSNIPLFLNNH